MANSVANLLVRHDIDVVNTVIDYEKWLIYLTALANRLRNQLIFLDQKWGDCLNISFSAEALELDGKLYYLRAIIKPVKLVSKTTKAHTVPIPWRPFQVCVINDIYLLALSIQVERRSMAGALADVFRLSFAKYIARDSSYVAPPIMNSIILSTRALKINN